MSELRELLREAIEVVHQCESIRRHADPNDKTGWNVHGIETCADPLCVGALEALARPTPQLEVGRLAKALKNRYQSNLGDLELSSWEEIAEAVADEYDRLAPVKP